MSRRLESDAFSLIEVVLAVAVVAVTLLAVLEARNQAIRLSAEAREKLQAASAADEKLTELMLAGFPRLAGQSGEADGLSWRVEEEYLSDPKLGNVRKVEVAVTGVGGREPLSRLSVLVPEEK